MCSDCTPAEEIANIEFDLRVVVGRIDRLLAREPKTQIPAIERTRLGVIRAKLNTECGMLEGWNRRAKRWQNLI